MANTSINLFDAEVLKRIRLYISMNDLDMKKTASEAGMTYIQLWSTLNRNKSIKLCDYVSLCRAFHEPLDTFLPKD